MENASKALIIAGAILISIVIISLGIIIFNQAESVMDPNAMDEVAVTTFNQKFKAYEGNNVRGANVNTLLERIVQNNLTNSDDTSKQIEVEIKATNWNTGTKPSGKITSISAKASTGKSYKVTSTPDTKSGYITKITIEDAQ